MISYYVQIDMYDHSSVSPADPVCEFLLGPQTWHYGDVIYFKIGFLKFHKYKTFGGPEINC